MEEVWRTIPGIETHEVSNMGRVRSKDRISKVAAKGLGGHEGTFEYERKLKGRLLSPHYTSKYIQYCINDREYSAHRLVAMAFIPNDDPEHKVEINHKDGDKLNNRVDNLEWCTHSHNEKHSYAELGKQVWNKDKHYSNKLAQQHRRDTYMKRWLLMLADSEAGMSAKEIAQKYNKCVDQVWHDLKKAREYKEKENEQMQ